MFVFVSVFVIICAWKVSWGSIAYWDLNCLKNSDFSLFVNNETVMLSLSLWSFAATTRLASWTNPWLSHSRTQDQHHDQPNDRHRGWGQPNLLQYYVGGVSQIVLRNIWTARYLFENVPWMREFFYTWSHLKIWFCYMSLLLPKIGQILVWVAHWDQYITWH